MSDPLSNAEIQDVLSSIRRLVSEDRRLRTPVPVAEEEEKGAGKLLLTDALRVETPAAEAGEETPDDTPTEVSLVNVVSEEEQDARWPVNVSEMPAAPAIRPASVLEEDLASLESTIAELEAAVAGIGAEFEPDGSEVAKTTDPSALALEEAFDDGFVVDTGGPVPVRPDDRSISAAVTEDADLAPEIEDVADDVAEAEDHGPDEITFLRSGPVGRRSDWQVISGDMGRQGNTGRLHLTASEASEASGEEFVTEEADAPDLAEGAPEAPEAVEEAGHAAKTPEPAEEALVAPETPEEDFAAPEDALAAPDGDETAEAAFAEAEPAGTLQAVEDAEAGPVDTTEAAEEALTEADLSAPAGADVLPAAAMAGAAAMADEAPEEGEEDGVDLFSQDDEAVIDMEMLRDLISDVIREELQGPLGERITRNVRKLVRQEIARALEAQKFE